ncbi:hypothetical protein SAMN02746066_03420 [Anaerosporobacter mobilis DSM 15930]|uniref:Uncharacterized protein n=1 Tax=Anaerosporobacter mobilis DSM 15930 TaxID=1120996 RepID=A0A1M7LUT1_9FIRM|nr:hypothetical protein [Anaerosporobacter mobilis]SHM81983.1 hypothetical protein SAMN02746066_03420 [Anaerosporobacter mobilis DSM 15930]
MIKRYDGSNNIDIESLKRFDSINYVDAESAKRFDGLNWVDCWKSSIYVTFMYHAPYPEDTMFENLICEPINDSTQFQHSIYFNTTGSMYCLFTFKSLSLNIGDTVTVTFKTTLLSGNNSQNIYWGEITDNIRPNSNGTTTFTVKNAGVPYIKIYRTGTSNVVYEITSLIINSKTYKVKFNMNKN